MDEVSPFSLRALRFIAPGAHAFISARALPSPALHIAQDPAQAPAAGGFLRILSDLLTLAVMAQNLVEFYTNGARWGEGSVQTYIYLSVLSAYAGDRALGQWAGMTDIEMKRRKGWLFVVAWVVFGFTLASIAGYFKGRFRTPHDIGAIVGGVLAIFLGSLAGKKYIAKLQGGGSTAEERLSLDQVKDGILAALAGVPAGLTCAELAERVGANKTTTRRALQALAKEGKIARDAGSATDPNTKYRLAAP